MENDSYSTAYVYGQRSNKYTASSETLYFNKMWTLHTDSGNNVYGGQTAKNIYLGETRIVTKLNSGTNPTYQEEYYKQYYYHSDHLGSASLISDYKGDAVIESGGIFYFDDIPIQSDRDSQFKIILELSVKNINGEIFIYSKEFDFIQSVEKSRYFPST